MGECSFTNKNGIQQTVQKKNRGIYTVVCKYRRKRPNTVGKRPNTVGKRPNFGTPPQQTTVNFLCFCKHFIKENKGTVTKADNKQRKKLTTESKDEQNLPVKEWNVLFSMPTSIIVWVHASVILNQCNASCWRWIKIKIYICFSTGFMCKRLHCPIEMSRYDYN
jgi:hypothetical protein